MHEIEDIEDFIDLSKATYKLQWYEKEVIELRFSTEGKRPMSFEQIGKKMGISTGMAKRIYTEAIAALAESMKEK
jgi:DNA-directed RNA polymerase specialized sigma subunit